MKKKMTYKTEEQNEMIKFFVVLLVVVGIIVGVYLISKVLIKEEVSDITYQTGTVNTNVVIVGTMLTAPEKEYYVLAYDTEGNDANAYTTYAGYYKNSQENAIKIYFLDLQNGMNKDYFVKENSNPKATKIKDLKIKDGTLIKIQNGHIAKYIEGLDNIKNELKVTKEKK